MALYRMPKDDELRAKCWDCHTCSSPSLCACVCHALTDAVDVVDAEAAQ